MNKMDINKLLDFAVSIIIRSGRISRKYFRTGVEISNKSNRTFDPVTVADREVEAFLRKQIEKNYPDHGIYGEEHGHKSGNAYTWFIDPIDGTKGYISGAPMWGSLLGVMKNKRPLIGIMHQPFVGETFFADGSNAWWKHGNKRRILKTSTVKLPEKAILYCTHPAMFENRKDQKQFKRVEAAVKNSRFGGDCYGYCLLAAGYVDVVIEAGLKPYDIVPLIPIIKSAGGVVTDWEGNPAVNGGKVVAAANKRLHGNILSILNS